MIETFEKCLTIPAELSGQRFDIVLAKLLPELSRARLQQWIKGAQVTIDGRVESNKFKVHGGEQVVIQATIIPAVDWQAKDISFETVYEDDELLVVNKEAGRVVHPAAGHRDDTLVNALLNTRPSLESIPRAGVVHRLDKDTSGLLVIAKTLQAHASLVAQLEARTVSRMYYALVVGEPVAGGKVDAPMARHPKQRKKMAVISSGKPAVTHYRIEKKYRGHTLLRVSLETGRTHQIRVHLAHIHYPIVGDPLYGGRLAIPAKSGEHLATQLRNFRRQALHAFRLELSHPATHKPIHWQIGMAPDLQQLLHALDDDLGQGFE
jgi:23S rRNA pseudouridine1911/1915/1917 synthase